MAAGQGPPPELQGLFEGQGRAARDKAHRLAWADVQRTDLNQRFGPSADPTQSHWISKFDLGNASRIMWGRIVDAVPYVNAYKVQVENGVTTLICTMLSQTSLQPGGVRDYGHLQPGTPVFFFLHPQTAFGLIVGVEPEYMRDGRAGTSDFISQAGRSGLAVEDSHKTPFQLENNSQIVDWSAGRPFDSITAGEKGWMAATGLGIHVDDFMTFMRVSEETGVWGFYPDDVLRAAGHNLQVWSACREREDLDDEGEVTSVEQYTPYLWEGLGLFRADGGGNKNSWSTTVPARGTSATIGMITYGGEPTPITIPNLGKAAQDNWDSQYGSITGGEETSEVTEGQGQAGLPPDPVMNQAVANAESQLFREYADYEWQLDPELQCYSAVEPAVDDQQGFYRLRDFYGYLGQGHKRTLQLPPQPVPGFAQAYSAQFQLPGVYEENLSLTGRKSLRTAHEYFVVRALPVPSPKQVKRQEDAGGDGVGNYKASGALGTGSDHKVKGQIPNDTGHDDGLIHALGFLDKQTFVFNWEGDHPFDYHRRDWYLPEEADLGYVPNTPQADYGVLRTATHLPTPTPVPMWVDHRYGYVNYYPGLSYMGLLESGGVLHGDSWGTEVRSSNGSLYLDAPADVYIRAGRNVVIEAGKDVIAKAKYSVDVSASLKDVRIKAEHGVYILGGNDKCGGVLIETLADQPALDFEGKQGEDVTVGGILLKAPRSMIGMCSDLHIITAECTTERKPAFLVNMPGGRIRILTDFVERFLTSAAFDVFITGSPCDEDAAVTRSVSAEEGYAEPRGPENTSSAASTGPDATVPELAGMEGPVGPVNTGFLGPGGLEGDMAFGGPAVTYANEYWSGRALLGGALRVAGQVVTSDSVYANGDFCTVQGHFFSPRASTVGGRVTTLKGDVLSSVEQAVTYTKTRSTELFGIMDGELNAMLGYPITEVCGATFSYRSVGQYKTENWTVPEPRWHQLNRAAKKAGAGTTAVWTEKPVWTPAGDPTYPYPGYERWAVAASVLTMDTALINLDNGLAYDRSGGLYEAPKYGDQRAVVPEGNYPTIF